MAPPGTDTKQRIHESSVQTEPSPALDRQLNVDHSCPLDTCTRSHAPKRAGSGQISNGWAFSARTDPDSHGRDAAESLSRAINGLTARTSPGSGRKAQNGFVLTARIVL
jgi:hypothetical protein